MAAPKTFSIRTFGCQMNEHDSERLAGLLVADGLVRAPDDEVADVVVLNTCTIRENADLKLYSALGHLKALKEQRPDMQIAVGGCMAQKDRGAIQQRANWVDVVFGTHNLAAAPLLLRRARSEGPLTEVLDAPDPEANRDMAPALYAVRESPFAAWITIQTGCDNTCAYCIVPSVRGQEISRPMQDVIDEATMLASSGVVELTVLGQNVNSYGRDITKRGPLFADLLRALGEVPGVERIRFTSPHPKDLRPETIAAMAETKAVCPQLHLPLQHGANRVLAAMRRGYSVERYLERLASAREAIFDLAVTTDLIVGFPGETEQDLEDTATLLEDVGYDAVFAFKYSPRPNTPAITMQDAIPEEEKTRRLNVLNEHQREIQRRNYQRHVGQVVEAMVEGEQHKLGQVPGRTTQNKPLNFTVPEGVALPKAGSYVQVLVTRAHPNSLVGEMISAEPTK